jgi:uncharacterized Zn-binding protein involved in type VI secretion
MTERACILRLDRTTAGGIVLDAIEDTGVGERGMSYIGARVQCPVCDTVGHIEANGLSADNNAIDGKLPALENDLCRCRCTPAPRLIASQRDWTYEG